MIRPVLLALVSGAALIAVACSKSEPAEETAPAPAAESGATPGAETPPAERAEPLGAPAMWTLSDEDTTIYLFGTVHVLKPDTDWRTPAFDAAFSSADTLILEADVVSEEAVGELTSVMMSLGTYGGKGSLSATLDDDEEKEVREALDTLSLPFSSIDPMKPWFAGLQLTNVSMVRQGYSPTSGVELTLTAEAQAAGKTFEYLETGVEQVNFFANMPEDDQIAFLVATSESIENDPEGLDELVADWAEGDLDGLADLMTDTDELGSKAVYDTLLVQRNQNWVPKIASYLDRPGTFMVAVGAGHLAGPDSVIAKLREAGYEVEGP